MHIEQPTEFLGTFLINPFGERYLYTVNGNVFNQTGAGPYFHTFFGDTLFKENTLYTIVGTDSGLLIKHILARGLPTGSRYVFVEPHEILPIIQEELPSLDERVAICTPDEWARYAGDFALHEYAYLDSAEIVQSLAVVDANLSLYRSAWLQVEAEFRQSIWQFSAQFGTKIFVEKEIENIAENRCPAKLLQGRFKGHTAILLAGGPSLDDMLPWVVRNRSHLLVFAVSRISRRLLQAGVHPDIIVSVDPHDVSFDVSREMLELSQHCILVHANHVLPRLLGQWNGRTLYMGKRYPWKKTESKENLVAVGPTVGNTALAVATEMGFKEIVLAGLDLCYSREGYSYASGSNERDNAPVVSGATQLVTTNSGATAETINGYFQAIRVFEQQARVAATRGCRLVNPAPGAARISGVEFMPLEEIRLPSQPIDAAKRLRELLPEDTLQARLADYQSALSILRKFTHEVDKVKQLSAEGLACNAKLHGTGGGRPDFKFKLRMDRIERVLDRRLKHASTLAKIFGMSQFIKTLRPQDNSDWSDEQVAQLGRMYYEAYEHGASALLKVLRTAERRLQSRVDEENASGHLEPLAEQWRRDLQPGRVLLWCKKHPNRCATAPDEALVKTLRAEYEANLSEVDTPHMRRSQAASRLNGTTAKAYEYLRSRDADGLDRIRQALLRHSSSEARPLRHLVEGYLAELEDRIDDAIEAYQYADEGKALENALQRLVSIALDRHSLDEAAVGLQALVAVSPAYMPQLAQLSRLRGDVHDAINVYTEYLLLAPDDTATMMKLAFLYRDLGINEGALTLFGHLLEKEPQNAIAKNMLNELSGRE